jgi:hypothetical protein
MHIFIIIQQKVADFGNVIQDIFLIATYNFKDAGKNVLA